MGDAVIAISRQLFYELRCVVSVRGEDAEYVDDCGVDPIDVIRTGGCQRGGDDRQPDLVLSPEHGLCSRPGDEGVIRVEHELKQQSGSVRHLGKACQATTRISPVTIVTASAERTERHD